MKKISIKKTLSIILSLAMMIGLIVMPIGTQAVSYFEETTINFSEENKMNAENWTVIDGDADNASHVTFNNSTVKLGITYVTGGGYEVGRIQAKGIPEGSRITEVSYKVVTAAEQTKRCLELIYDYTSLNSYYAIGISGNTTNSQYVYKRTATTGDNRGTRLSPGHSTAAASQSRIGTFNIKFTYTYDKNGIATCTLTSSNSNYSGEITVNLGTVTNPCVILSGGTKAGTNPKNTYGDYRNIVVKYETEINIDADVNAFKTSYPITALADVNAENAIECGKAANKAIEAYAALTDEKIKEALSDYAQEAQRIVEKVEIINSGCYAEDFSDSTLFEDVSVLTGTQVRGGTATNTFVNNTYSYENGVMKFVQTTGVNSLASSLKGTNVKMVQPLNDSREISKVTAKIALSGGGKWNPFKMNLGKAGSADEYHGIELYYSVNSETGLLTSLNFRVTRPNANASTNNDDTATSETILATKAPDINNSATYFNLEYIISAAGRPTAKLYAADGTTLLAKVAISDTNKLFVYSGTNTIGFGSLGLTAGYVDDLKVWYDGSETFVAPTMDGASIATTANVGEQDLRFQASYDPNATVSGNFKAVEYGMLVMTAAKMPSTNELTMAAVGKEELNVIVGKKNLADGETLPSTYYLELNGSGTLTAFNATIETIVGKRFVARAYVAYQDTVTGHIYYVYSDNENEKGTKDGQASKSVISVAKAIAQNVIANGAVDDGTIAGIISQTTTTTALQREQLLTFICNNKDKVVA